MLKNNVIKIFFFFLTHINILFRNETVIVKYADLQNIHANLPLSLALLLTGVISTTANQILLNVFFDKNITNITRIVYIYLPSFQYMPYSQD